MSEVTGEDIERLANRMAMLVSDDGEADNAGRAVGQLARRLGLSGGDLKQIVVAGFRSGAVAGQERLEREIATLRSELRAAEQAALAIRQDRDTLMAENGAMRVSMYRRRAAARMRRLLAGLAVLGLGLVAAGVVWLDPDIAGPLRTEWNPREAATAAVATRTAVVRRAGATVYASPEPAAQVIRRLPYGTLLLVHRLEWKSMMQWAQVEVDGRLGYVLMTELEM